MIFEHVLELKHHLLDLAQEPGTVHAFVLLCVVLLFTFRFFKHEKARQGVPILGYMSKYEPTVILKSRFTLGAREIIKQSYDIVSCPGLVPTFTWTILRAELY